MCQHYRTTYACGHKVNEWAECHRATIKEVRKTCFYNHGASYPRTLTQDCAGCKILKAQIKTPERAVNEDNASCSSRPIDG